MKRNIYLTVISSITAIVILFSLLARNGSFDFLADSSLAKAFGHEQASLTDTFSFTDFQAIDMNASIVDLRFHCNDDNEYLFSYDVSSSRLVPKVELKGNTLYIKQSGGRHNTSNQRAAFVLSVPRDCTLEDVILDIGVGDLDLTGLAAQKLDLDIGVGDIDLLSCGITDAAIDAGVGDVKLSSNRITNLNLDAGIGDVNIEGVAHLSDYALDIDVGMGTLSINGESKNGFGKEFSQTGNGYGKIIIDGGMGNVSLSE